jgi:hypothetical protein
MGADSEAAYHVLLARYLGYVEVGDYRQGTEQLQEIKRMLSALLKKIRVSQVTISPSSNSHRKLVSDRMGST